MPQPRNIDPILDLINHSISDQETDFNGQYTASSDAMTVSYSNPPTTAVHRPPLPSETGVEGVMDWAQPVADAEYPSIERLWEVAAREGRTFAELWEAAMAIQNEEVQRAARTHGPGEPGESDIEVPDQVMRTFLGNWPNGRPISSDPHADGSHQDEWVSFTDHRREIINSLIYGRPYPDPARDMPADHSAGRWVPADQHEIDCPVCRGILEDMARTNAMIADPGQAQFSSGYHANLVIRNDPDMTRAVSNDLHADGSTFRMRLNNLYPLNDRDREFIDRVFRSSPNRLAMPLTELQDAMLRMASQVGPAPIPPELLPSGPVVPKVAKVTVTVEYENDTATETVFFQPNTVDMTIDRTQPGMYFQSMPHTEDDPDAVVTIKGFKGMSGTSRGQ